MGQSTGTHTPYYHRFEPILAVDDTVELQPAARTFLSKKGYDPDYGARPLGRVIQTELKDRLADELLFGSLQKGGQVKVGVNKDESGEEVLDFSFA